MFKEYLEKLAEGHDLTGEEAEDALRQIISGNLSSEQAAAFIFGMRAKGESVEELTSFVRVMREAAVPVRVDVSGAVDLCGTGGDGADTFNISTAAMFVTAGAGVPVLKHGNRSVSSQSGSADVLEALGAVATLPAEEAGQVFNETGLTFMFAPYFHPAMKHVMPARKALAIRTFFNVLGPLLNPAGVRRQMVGAFDGKTARTIIHILSNLDTEQAFSLHADDGLDEVTLTSTTRLYPLKEGELGDEIEFNPEQLGFDRVDSSALKGGDKDHNADIIRSIVDDKADPAHRNVVLLNAAFGIRASGKTDDLEEARDMAIEGIKSGTARQALDNFVQATKDVHKKS